MGLQEIAHQTIKDADLLYRHADEVGGRELKFYKTSPTVSMARE